MTTCFIGLGSNLGEPSEQVNAGIAAISELEGVRLTGQSSLYRSEPMGPKDQPDYCNAVIRLETELGPLELLAQLQDVEASAGRDRSGPRWGPRTLDLDLLMHGDLRIASKQIQLPHPGIADRNFVLIPLAELAPSVEVPGLGEVGSLADIRGQQGLSLWGAGSSAAV